MQFILANLSRMFEQIGLVPMLIIGLFVLIIVWWCFRK